MLDGIVLKFPSFRGVWGVVINIPRMLWKGDGRFIAPEFKWGWKVFTRGIHENRTEWKTWNSLRSPFLAPTMCSLGLVNIQRRIPGSMPDESTMHTLMGQLPAEAQQELKGMDHHAIEPSNFIQNTGCYYLVDYGGSNSDYVTFPTFLRKWNSALQAICITSQDTQRQI